MFVHQAQAYMHPIHPHQATDPASLDAIFVAIGGGGLIAGIAAYVKALHPHISVIGVEPCGANAMAMSLQQGRRIALSRVDAFADGVAVKYVRYGGRACTTHLGHCGTSLSRGSAFLSSAALMDEAAEGQRSCPLQPSRTKHLPPGSPPASNPLCQQQLSLSVHTCRLAPRHSGCAANM